MERKRSLGPISGCGLPKVDSEVEVLLSLPLCSTLTTTAAGEGGGLSPRPMFCAQSPPAPSLTREAAPVPQQATS